MTLEETAFENDDNSYFLPSPKCFQLDQLKALMFQKELPLYLPNDKILN